MSEIILEPYLLVQNKNFGGDTTIQLTPEIFENKDFIDGRFTYYFENCYFDKLIIKNSNKINFKILFGFNSCIIKNLEIENLVTENISIVFFSSIITGSIKDCPINLELTNCFLTETLFVEKINSLNISYTEDNINPLKWKKLFHKIGINKHNLSEFIKKSNKYLIQDIKKFDFYFSKSSSEKKGIISRIEEKGRKAYYYPTESEKRNLNLSLALTFSNNFDHEYVKINNAYLYNFSLKGTPSCKIDIDDSKIHRIYLHNFNPKNEFVMYNIKPLNSLFDLTQFEIHKCRLDNTWFDNVDFTKYKTISFYRTRFSNTTFTSCTFSKKGLSFKDFQPLENIHDPEQKRESYYKDQYETFLQLKLALEKTSNVYEAQKLQAISFDALKQIKDVKRQDKFILWLNKQSNNHNLEIIRPFCVILIISIVFYILYLFSLSRIFNSNNIDYKLIGYYFSFLDITHRTDFLVDKKELNGFSVTIDYFNKLLMGYLIYQFIASFRKYGKK